MFRGLAARLNYLVQDRPDLQYSAKEISRRMARPSQRDWALLKRAGRYLVGAPRAVHTFFWQREQTLLETSVDSDWAGCTSYLPQHLWGGGAARLALNKVVVVHAGDGRDVERRGRTFQPHERRSSFTRSYVSC